MKKTLFTFGIALLTAIGAWAQTTFTVDKLKYTVTDETAHTVRLIDYESGLAGEVNIPATVTHESTTYTVTSIGGMVFLNCNTITAVTIPDGVIDIGDYAFYGCSAITAVTIPESVTSIGYAAFNNCTALTEITIPQNVTTIRDFAFDNCTSLTQINVNEANTAYCSENGILFNKDKTTLLQYPAGKQETTYTVPASVTTIGINAFGDCAALTTVTIGSGLTSIGEFIFDNCTALTQINVDEANTTYCSENGVLFNKDKTTLICYPAGKPEAAYIVPASVTAIGENAFTGCAALTQITLPKSLTNIEEYAFTDCAALTQITVLATVPPTVVESNAFDNVSRDIPVYVPAEALADYQAAKVWSEFTNLQAMKTALQTPSMPESIRVYDGQLHNPQGLFLTLYDVLGRKVYSGNDATLSQPAGAYVLRCAGASRKVVF